MNKTLRYIIVLAAVIIGSTSASARLRDNGVVNTNVTGGELTLSYQKGTNDPVAVTAGETDVPAGATVTIVAGPSLGYTLKDFNITAQSTAGSGNAEARTFTRSNGPGIGQTIAVSPMENVPGIYTFTMPDGVNVLISATFKGEPTAQTTYIDPTKSAGQQECSATAYILDGKETVLGVSGQETWYVCTGNVAYTSQINLLGDVHLILADGKTMNVDISNADNGIDGTGGSSLTVYGQSLGTGELNVTTYGNAIEIPGSFTLNGGRITAYGLYGLKSGSAITINDGVLKASGTSAYGIYCEGDFTVNGGKVIAHEGYGNGIIQSNGKIVLGWSDPKDYIFATQYICKNYQMCTAEGKRFVAYVPTKSPREEGFNPYEPITKATAIVSGTSGEDTFMYPDLIGNMLRPIDGNLVTVAGGISLMDGTTAKTPDFSITTGAGTESVVTTPYYLFKASTEETPVTLTLSYSGTDFAKLSDLPEGTTLNPVDGKPMQRSFAMPAEDVALTTTAVDVSNFTLSPNEFICDGTAKTPSVMNGESVFDAANYTMTFKQDGDDASITEAKKVGVYNVVLTGCGQYLGTATLTNAFSIKTRVKFSVVDVADGEKLEGAAVQVIGSEGIVVEEWTSTDKSHVIEGLKTGEEYTLKETVAPEGYTIPADITFTIDKEGKVTTTGFMTQEGVLLVENSKTKVEISVVDKASGETLEGATVQVIDSEGNVVEEWVSTTENYVIEGLKTGEEYTLKETVARDGYTIPDDITFTIDETGKITITTTGTITESGVLLVENSKTKVEISVVEIGLEKELAGATVQVIDSEGNVAEEWTSTDESHVTEGLKTGEEYTLRETVAPDGYIISTDITFTIDETGKITTTGSKTEDGVLLVENSRTKVEFSVVDKASGETLEGATVQVIGSKGDVVDAWTSTDESHVIEGLKTGEEYTLRETVAPDGYIISTDITFTIDKDGQVTSTGPTTTDEEGNTVLLVENSMTHVEFSVVDKATGETLEGATVQVIDSEKNVVDEWVSTTENYVIEGLKTGEEYTLRETVVPTGYAIPADITFTIDNAGHVTTTDGMTTTDEEGNTVLVLENPFTVPLFAAEATNLWMTWCDKDEYVKPEGVTVYTVSGVENNTVTLGEVSDVIPAYTPVLIYRAAAGTAAVTAVFSSHGTGTDGIQTAEATGCTFYGNPGSTAFNDDGSKKHIFPFGTAGATEQSYILKGGTFIPVDDLTGGIPAHRCWLNVSTATTNGARSLGIVDGGSETTGMTPPLTPPLKGAGSDGGSNSGQASTGWYSIDGRRLQARPATKGLYIHNGQKTVIK